MANGEDKSDDLYAILGLDKECTGAELRIAYKKLAMRWHPDRWSASGNSKFVEEAKKKFQAIQRAYSVLSDSNKRLLYDVGAYDSDEDENGMGDFLNEMAVMMSQTKPSENGDESFEQLQELFLEMFQEDIDGFASSSQSKSDLTSSSFGSFGESSSSSNSGTSQINYLETQLDRASSYDSHLHSFSLGVEQTREFKKGRGSTRGVTGGSSSGSRCRHGRKQKGDEGVAQG